MRRHTRLFDQEPKQTCLVVFELSPDGSKSRSTPAELPTQEHVQGTRSPMRLEEGVQEGEGSQTGKGINSG